MIEMVIFTLDLPKFTNFWLTLVVFLLPKSNLLFNTSKPKRKLLIPSKPKPNYIFSGKQGGMIMPRNMATSECPSLG